MRQDTTVGVTASFGWLHLLWVLPPQKPPLHNTKPIAQRVRHSSSVKFARRSNPNWPS